MFCKSHIHISPTSYLFLSYCPKLLRAHIKCWMNSLIMSCPKPNILITVREKDGLQVQAYLTPKYILICLLILSDQIVSKSLGRLNSVNYHSHFRDDKMRLMDFNWFPKSTSWRVMESDLPSPSFEHFLES